jgi:Icc-related predicted phosphoesterase
MTILALTDIHGSYDRMEEIIRANQHVDIIVIGGDVTTYGTPKEIAQAIDRAKASGKPVLAVCGNMDPPVLESSLESLGVSINGRGVIIDDVGFFGVSACPFSPLHTPNEVSEETIMQLANAGCKEVASARWKVFVPHTPPANTKLDRIFSGKNVGSNSVRTFIEKHQPDVTICGHIHEARGTDMIGQTHIVNCGQVARGFYALIDVGKEITVTMKP